MMPQDPVVGGNILRRPAIQSPNYVPGVSGWSINADGTAQFNQLTLIVQASGAAILIYAGVAGAGTLIGSWAGAAGTDQYGNPFPQGISVTAGILTGVSISSAAIVASTIANTLISGGAITAAAIAGGTMTETAITFDSSGGRLLVYTSTTTVVTLTTASGSTWTAPAGNYTQGKIECWGADAGGGGGNATQGGEAGGAGAYACNPTYPLTPSGLYAIDVGNGGQGGVTNAAGASGGQTAFDNTGVVALGGSNGAIGIGGQGGAAGPAPIAFKGGNGGSNPSGFTSSAGGGGRAGSTGPGGNGTNPTGNGSPGFGGAAGTGVGGLVGSNGVVAATNGNGGNAGGSGAGSASGVTNQAIAYDPTSTDCYYGSGSLKNHNGTLFQGAASGYAGVTGNQYGFVNYNFGKIQSDFAGWVIDQVTLTINCQGSWYNSGGYISYGYANSGGNHYSQSYYWVNAGVTNGPTDVTAVLGPKIAGGAAWFEALTIGPDPSFQDLNNYVYFQGGAGQGGPRLVVHGHQGGATKQAGGGSDGLIKVTYTSASVLGAAVAPVAGTDTAGNAYGAGFTGPARAFTPGVSPTTVETWRNVTPPSGWTGTLRYKMLAEANRVALDIKLTHAALTVQTNLALFTLPVGYRPTVDSFCLGSICANNSATQTPAPFIYVPTSGGVTAYYMPTGTNQLDCHETFPID